MTFLQDLKRSLAELRRHQKKGSDPQLIADCNAATRKLAEIEREEQKLLSRVCKTEDEGLIGLYESRILALQSDKKRYMEFSLQADERKKAVIDFESLTNYCVRVSDALETFSFGERRLALEAVGTKVFLRCDEWKLETYLPTQAGEMMHGKASAQS